ncbi:pentatricopeptide repeat-containing protein At4g21705, mitochondrial-like [Silene latifolia]|uniref:pentatricopeptide repeat-containing protein At4g21705, mitochondrial-like n=1 Tax=Silene latifolia TaxID=37657 RepID=UPI003D770EF4
MNIPKSSSILHQLISKSIPKSLKNLISIHPTTTTTKTHLNSPFKARNISNTASKNNPLVRDILKFLAKSPQSSVVPLLVLHYGDKSDFQFTEELRNVIRTLRRQRRFCRALEVSEWAMSKTVSNPKPGDLASQLSLINQVHGLDAAEKFFNEVDVHTEKTYGALLNCYVEAKLVDKSLSHFKTMKGMGFPMNSLPYNNMMTLYLNTGQSEKVTELISEMEENGISPDNITYRIWLKALASKLDFTSMETVIKKMEGQHGLTIDWLTYVVVANYHIEGGLTEKAVYYLQQAELKVQGNPVAFNHLITTYAKIGDLSQVMSLWQRRSGISKAHINPDYMAMIGSLVKLDQFQEAEGILLEWESLCSFYDFRVVNALLLGYTQKGQVERAEKLLDGILSSRKIMPIPNTWSIISVGHIKCGNMQKALLCLKKALELGLRSQHRGWIPNYEVTSSILKWLGDEGEIREVDEFLKLLSQVIPMNEDMYRTLLMVNIRHGNEIDDILERMKDDKIDVSEETRKIIESRT